MGSEVDPEAIYKELCQQGFEPRIEGVVAFAQQHHVLLMRHQESGLELDLSFAWLAFEDHALQHAEALELQGVSVPVARAEDLVIYKAVSWRERDRRDLRELLYLHGAGIDLVRVRQVLAEFAEAIEAPERVEQFEQLVRSIELGRKEAKT